MTHCVFAINFFKALKIYGQNALPPHNAGLSLDDPCASVQLNPPRPIQYKKKHLLSPLRTHVRTPIPKLPSRNTYPGYQVSLSTYVRKPLGLSENWLKNYTAIPSSFARLCYSSRERFGNGHQSSVHNGIIIKKVMVTKPPLPSVRRIGKQAKPAAVRNLVKHGMILQLGMEIVYPCTYLCIGIDVQV